MCLSVSRYAYLHVRTYVCGRVHVCLSLSLSLSLSGSLPLRWDPEEPGMVSSCMGSPSGVWELEGRLPNTKSLADYYY